MNISPVIRDLLLHNQKAVIPGFGTFMIIQRPAQLNKVTRVLSPPVKVIRFDNSQQTDDGKLAEYLITKLKQDKDVALKAIDAYIQKLRDSINESGAVQMEGLGTLNKKKSGDIEFTPEEDLQKRIALFELPKINIPAPPVEKEPVVTRPPIATPVVTTGKKRLWWIPAAVIVVLLALAGIIYTTGNAGQFIADVKALFGKDEKKESERIVFGSRSTSDTSVIKDTLREEISRELDEQVDRDKALVFKEEQPVNTVSENTEHVDTDTDKLLVSGITFHIIAGAFLVPNNAERLETVLEKQGLQAEVLPKWGEYYLVSLGSFESYRNATIEMEKLNAKLDKDLWIMKRQTGNGNQ